MLSVIPIVIAAVVLHTSAPEPATLPASLEFIKPVGYIVLVPGVALWLTGVTQLLIQFPKGKLITTGVYGVCRNPIYL